MKLSLELVRETLRKTLGRDSFVASYISELREDEKVETASITKDGILRYSSNFIKNYITSDQDLFCLLFHEILHPLFSHYMYGQGKLVNLACDAVINAVISQFYPSESGGGSLFKKFYQPKGIELILRPESKPEGTRYEYLYRELYRYAQTSHERMSTAEVIQALKVLTDVIAVKAVILLGSHGEGGEKTGRQTPIDFPVEFREKLAKEIQESFQRQKQAGYGDNLYSLICQVLKTHLSIKKRLLADFLTKRKIDRFIATNKTPRRITSPFPLSPSKKDVVLLAAGIWPGYFHSHTFQEKRENKGVVVYLDVSGSVNQQLPRIIGILKNFQNDMKSIYLFSNKVVDIDFKELVKKGKVLSTYGTDFDCVAESIIEKAYEKAIIITDGYASLQKENAKELKKRQVSIMTILFDHNDKCEDLEPFGPVINLKDVITGR